MNKKIIIVGIIVLLIAVGLSGCEDINILGPNLSVTISEPFISTGSELTVNPGPLFISLTVKGDKSTYDITLKNQNGVTVGLGHICEADIAEGKTEKYAVSMGESFYRTGSKREYTLSITDEYSGKEVYSKTLSYYGADISIINCSDPIWHYNPKCDMYDFDNFYISIYNNGDLPTPPLDEDLELKVTINGTVYNPEIFNYDCLEFNPSTQIEEPNIIEDETESRYIDVNKNKVYWAAIIDASESASLKEGEYNASVELVHDGTAMNMFSTKVKIESSQNKKPHAVIASHATMYSQGYQLWNFADGSSDSDGHITRRYWDLGNNGKSSGTTSGYMLYENDGEYTVKLMVWDDEGAKDSTFIVIQVDNP